MTYSTDVRDDDLTNAILERAIEVHKALGPEHRESTYRNSLAHALQEDGFDVEVEVDFEISFRGRDVARGAIDLMIGDAVALELKVVKRLMQKHFHQLGRNVRNTNATRGLLINFGNATIDVRRFVDGYPENASS